MRRAAPSKPEFARIVRECHAAVYRAAFRLVRNDADALDVTQQVFLRVLEGKVDLAGAESEGRVLAFLGTKTALQFLRGERNRRRHETGGVGTMRERGTGSAADEREIPRHVDRLPDDLRVPVVLRFGEGMTFAHIAEALDCSEPTAHDRVRRGLERLRFDLAKAGFASAVFAGVGLEEALARTSAAAAGGSIPVPKHVEVSLLSLGATVAATGSLAALAPALATIVVVLALGVGATYLAIGERGTSEASSPGASPIARATPPSAEPRTSPPARSVEPSADAQSESAANAASTADASVPAAATGEIEGRVVDESGAGVAGADVRAESAERSGKLPRFVARATTDEGGDFRIEVPAHVEDGQVYSLVVTHERYVLRRSEKVSVRPGEVASVEPLAVIPSSADREGEYACDVLVTDGAGGPVEGAAVVLHRRVRTPAGTVVPDWEAGAPTNSEGRVRLEGKRLGEKLLRVDARSKGFRRREEIVPIGEPGSHVLEIALEPGLVIAGTLRAAAGDALAAPERATVVAVDVADARGDDWIHAEVNPEDGTFRIVGLGPGPYRLIASADGYSEARFDRVTGGTDDLAIRLKLAGDEDDAGDHEAEIHGTVRDARSGALVSVEGDAVDVEWLPADASDEELRRDVFPTLLAAAPRQVAFGPGGGPPPPSAEFHMTGLDAGAYAIVARERGYAPCVAGPFRLAAKEITRGVVMKLDRGVAIEGTVTGPDGAPVRGASVFLVGDGPRSRERVAEFDESVRETAGRGTVMIWGDVKTDASGKFAFAHAPADLELRVAAVHPKLAPAVAPAAEKPLVLALRER